MPLSALNLTRMANNAPGQHNGKQQPSPIRCERLIMKQQGQHQPKRQDLISSKQPNTPEDQPRGAPPG